MIKKKCPLCQRSFEAIRRTKIYCGDTCRSNNHQKQKRRKKAIKRLEKDIKKYAQQILQHQDQLTVVQQALEPLQQKLKEKQDELSEVKRLMALDDQQLSRHQEIEKHHKSAALPKALDENVLFIAASGVLAFHKALQAPKILADFRKKLATDRLTLSFQVSGLSKDLSDKHKALRCHENKIEALQASLLQAKEDYEQLLSQVSPAKKRKPSVAKTPTSTSITPVSPTQQSSGIKASELAAMEFKTFNLAGELGRFMGQMERYKLSIALTGDPGAGKSNISMALAAAFAQVDLKVCFYTLEMGIGQALQDIIRRYPVPDEVHFFDQGDVEDIKLKATQFDVIIVDSFVKLNCDAKVLDELRHAFPETIFVFILQKTSQGSSRGGVALDYDASMVMDVTFNKQGQRQVYMKKSRYGTPGWTYLPISNRVLSAGSR